MPPPPWPWEGLAQRPPAWLTRTAAAAAQLGSPRPDLHQAWRQTATAQHWLLPEGLGHCISQASRYISHQGLAPLQGHRAPLNTEAAPYAPHPTSVLPKQPRGISGAHLCEEMLINSNPCPAGTGSCSDTCQLVGERQQATDIPTSRQGLAKHSSQLCYEHHAAYPEPALHFRLRHCSDGGGSQEREDTHSSNKPQQSTGAEPRSPPVILSPPQPGASPHLSPHTILAQRGARRQHSRVTKAAKLERADPGPPKHPSGCHKAGRRFIICSGLHAHP